MDEKSQSSRKSSRNRKETVFYTTTKSKYESKQQTMRSETPPLPKRRTSIEELIKQRESLKKQLKIIYKNYDNDEPDGHITSKSEKPQQHSTTNHSPDQMRKRRNEDSPKLDHVKKKKPVILASPETHSDNAQSESEDEEEIIERRRLQRKQLLEKFKSNDKDVINDKMPSESTKREKQQAKLDVSTETQKETTDMFAEKDDFLPKTKPIKVTQDIIETNAKLSDNCSDNWDDSDGYYNIRLGDEINKNRYVIESILGQGMFANVVKALDKTNGKYVAVKIVRNNELMLKNGMKELFFLKKISRADAENKYHCVRHLGNFLHKRHLCIVLESLNMDLRTVLKKYGKYQGINVKALTSYTRQLLMALRLLKKMEIIHADIKPDNILVNEDKTILKLCDFGSASTVEDNEATPYVVSRYYRAPEVILGIPYTHSVDIWSTACTMYELATGRILFTGSSNNKMLKCFMDLKGKFSSKVIRKGKFKDQHFNYKNNFILHKKDEISGRIKLVEMSNISITRNLHNDFTKYSTNLNEDEQKKMLQLKDILDKMLVLDMNHRYTVSDCLKHQFIQDIPK